MTLDRSERHGRGLRARSRRGPIGRTWWSARWTAVLESIGLGDRLNRGRTLARSGNVLALELQPGSVTAEVAGGRQEVHRVTLAMAIISADDWTRLLEILSRRAIFAARLLAGEIPPAIEEAFAEAGLTLFPSSVEDLETDCSCADLARPCSHAAAVLYLLAERFDEDPFQIFLFRGCAQAELLEGLQQRREDEEETALSSLPVTPTLDGAEEIPLDRYWELGSDLSPLDPRIVPPVIPEAVLRRLGPPPGATHGSAGEESLRSAYRIASAWALKLALREEGSDGLEQ